RRRWKVDRVGQDAQRLGLREARTQENVDRHVMLRARVIGRYPGASKGGSSPGTMVRATENGKTLPDESCSGSSVRSMTKTWESSRSRRRPYTCSSSASTVARGGDCATKGVEPSRPLSERCASTTSGACARA